MYKNIFYGVAFLLLPLAMQAQHIPDPNFAQAIAYNCPSCIDGNNDLTIDAQSVTDLYVDAYGITDLTGIDGFTALLTLYCGSNDLTSLPNLPSSLVLLDCSENQLTSLPALPSSLVELYCEGNQLISLPTLPTGLSVLQCGANPSMNFPTLPTGLTQFICNNNEWTSLPALPTGLSVLHCSNNPLNSLPTLPTGLTLLACQYNQLTNLPTLPTGLTNLDCRNNQLTNLPTLPTGLTDLYCDNNQLTNLPTLPTGLTYLNCSNNPSMNLPTLPTGLTNLVCGYNGWTSLPALPTGLTFLNCQYNQLTSLPTLPTGLTSLHCTGNQLTNLPTLPNSIRILFCGENLLTALPALPSALEFLRCFSNQLTNIPALPSGLRQLYCYDNQLTGLPALPVSGFVRLWCYDNPNLNCLPILPASLPSTAIGFNITNTAISCLPNRPANFASYPLPDCPAATTENACSTTPYVWSANGQTYTTSGTYNHVNGCGQTETLVLTVVPNTLSATISKTNNLCHNDCAGTATVNITSGVAPYSYAWSNGQTTQTATDMCYGAYNVTVSDANGCSIKKSSIFILQSSAIGATPTITNKTCSVLGSISVAVSGGTGTKTFLWSNGANTSSITGLSNSGTYHLTVTDANGCQEVFSYFVDDICFSIAISKNDITTCTQTCTGDATVTTTNGMAPYTYLWSNGQTAATATGLCKQNYTVSVTDANNVLRTASISITHSSLAATYIATPTTCNGICDGTATVSPSGAQAPYTFAWNNNAGNQTTQTATGLCYGTYNVTITSANGCSMVKKYITVGQPSAIALTTSSTAASCANDGTATVSVNNGVAPFVYAWSNAGNTASITGLASGTYTVTVTDANGCMKTKNVTVANACGAKPTENGNLLAEQSILDESMPADENTDINETLRLNDFALVDAFNVYPNPNQGQFTIDIQLAAEANALLRIHDVLGRTLLEQNLEGQSFQVAIDAKTWTNGNYFVQLISNKGQTTRKVLVSNE